MGSLATQVDEVRDLLQEKADRLMEAAASHMDRSRLIEMAARCCIANPKLLECSRASLVSAVAEAANLGLELGGVLGQAYLVPYGDQAQLVPGYLGLKELAYRSDLIDMLDAAVVHDGDEFEYELGTSCFLRHRPTDEPSTIITHAYALAQTARGGWVVRVMSFKQIERHRDKFAKGHKRRDSPWQTNFEAMAIKTVLRRLYKLLPLASEIQTLVNRDEYIEHGAPATTLQSGDDVPGDDLDRIASNGSQETAAAEDAAGIEDPAPPEDAAEAHEQETATAADEIPW